MQVFLLHKIFLVSFFYKFFRERKLIDSYRIVLQIFYLQKNRNNVYFQKTLDESNVSLSSFDLPMTPNTRKQKKQSSNKDNANFWAAWHYREARLERCYWTFGPKLRATNQCVWQEKTNKKWQKNDITGNQAGSFEVLSWQKHPFNINVKTCQLEGIW